MLWLNAIHIELLSVHPVTKYLAKELDILARSKLRCTVWYRLLYRLVTSFQTLLSLSKLALLASSEEEKNDKVRKLNEQLHHVEVQQSLPSEVLEVGGSVR